MGSLIVVVDKIGSKTDGERLTIGGTATMNVRNIACACILTAGLTAMSVWADNATGPAENKTEAPVPSAAVAGTVTNTAPTLGMQPAESVPVPAAATKGMAETNSVSAAPEPSPAQCGPLEIPISYFCHYKQVRIVLALFLF